MQPPPHILESGTEAGERFGLEVDVAKFDRARLRRLEQPIALPVDPGVTDGASCVVPDGELDEIGHVSDAWARMNAATVGMISGASGRSIAP
jgi:hypothetical protein